MCTKVVQHLAPWLCLLSCKFPVSYYVLGERSTISFYSPKTFSYEAPIFHHLTPLSLYADSCRRIVSNDTIRWKRIWHKDTVQLYSCTTHTRSHAIQNRTGSGDRGHLPDHPPCSVLASIMTHAQPPPSSPIKASGLAAEIACPLPCGAAMARTQYGAWRKGWRVACIRERYVGVRQRSG